jgi:hypothetical protein
VTPAARDGFLLERERSFVLPDTPSKLAENEKGTVMTGSPDVLHGYHVHIYYNDHTQPIAAKLRDALAADFPVKIGKNSGIAGPHPVPQIQVILAGAAFPFGRPSRLKRSRYPVMRPTRLSSGLMRRRSTSRTGVPSGAGRSTPLW